MGPSQANVGMVHSSSSSGIFFQGDMQSQAFGNSHLGNSIPGNTCSNMVPVSGEITGASSLVTDANSGLSGGRLQRSASANNESYTRLPASPLSFTSNNMSISGSCVIDGPSTMQPSSNQDPPHSQQVGASTATSLPPPQAGPVSLPNGSRVLGSFVQDNGNLAHLQKKPRLDVKQEDIMQQQVLQQILQRQDSMQLQNSNPQVQSLIQQQRLRQQQQQQQLLQSLPPVQRAHLLQQQLQLRQQQSVQPANAMKRPYDGGVCSRRLMQYLYHQRQWPADNSISYWRKFVAEYYSPRAKKRWCLSLYDNVGHHSLGVFPQSAMDAWQCDICGSKSGRGFEATFEVLPRLNEIKFGSGVIDELLFLDLPREYRFPSGIMVLEYGQAVQESIYEQLRVVREGQLKVIFTPDLKILTWEFCARRHEELLPRRLVAPQVNQLLQVAQKCQSTIAESASDGVSQQDLQTNSNMVVTAGRLLARSLELQSLNDLGFSKRYVRCLQISEVVNSMKDLIDFCRDTKAGPIEGLKRFPRKTNMANSQSQKMQEMEQVSSKLVPMNPSVNGSSVNNSQYMGNRRASLCGSAQAALALPNYQNIIMRQNSVNSNAQQEASSSFNISNQNGYPFQGMAVGGFQQRPTLQAPQSHQQAPHSGGHAIQQHMIQQLLQDMSNGVGGQKPSVSGQSAASESMSMGREGLRYGISSSATSPLPPVVPTRSNSFKGASHSDSSAGNAGVGNPKAATTNLPNMCDDSVLDIASEFMGNGFFDNDELEGIGYGWKA
ncbi:putative LIM-domain binding protein/SEUSS [Helianthus annuus]|uniref:LIM-domain binding protein/SEUSS n=1 Tax=Helianthus annuus TaxID=4232 RepID=A0A251UP14_HELAN|nr:probable transcriptional regulator SLK2 [Helianthus annuus]KAF5805525.1 putative LIM-domain binding protein/SEUSS [Helianthus annuus]KAJ0569944.1 putative LIM-domain binding protein/SEUSS [Helianthus annuus]KAJ0576628.1 putative LIM-domain binding protein/SEUSS [Helianthus annuus]KAJ0584273.1 putative LIM-domain binding protein/SEUSS [Helianthus annuus]KAJ0746909.1 putative LIM-domain binding protein/SEUSS [Helianthus annuus]